MPVLKEGTLSDEDYLGWKIDFDGWAISNGVRGVITGPLGPAPTDPDKAEKFADAVSQGLHYVCAAVQDPNLRAAMVSNCGNKTGPSAIAWLSTEVLCGIAEQPAIMRILDSLNLQPDGSIVSFKTRFSKFASALNPAPAATTLCSKYITAISRETGTLYDDCITSAIAHDDQSDFTRFAALLTKLCTNKAARNNASNAETNSLAAEIEALRAQIKVLKANMAQDQAGASALQCQPCNEPQYSTDEEQELDELEFEPLF